MGSVARTAVVTAGLGAAVVAGAVGPAAAADNPAATSATSSPDVAQGNSGTIGPFSVTSLSENLPTGRLNGGLGSATGTAQQALPLNVVPGTADLASAGLPSLPGMPA